MAETLTKVVDNVVIELTAEEIAEYNARQEAADFDLSGIRRTRNGLLAASDWTQLDDAPLTDEQQEAWERYRQELRDLPQTYSRVSEVVWPTPPE
tara:strand:- start:2439 stop:2723 length:285 start_codon:yes stop_codon:yes gene_type:complete